MRCQAFLSCVASQTTEEQQRNAAVSASKMGYWQFPHPLVSLQTTKQLFTNKKNRTNCAVFCSTPTSLWLWREDISCHPGWIAKATIKNIGLHNIYPMVYFVRISGP
jgi:hypothetical protein